MHRSEDATALLGLEEFVVGAQLEVDGEVWLCVETTTDVVGCDGCGTNDPSANAAHPTVLASGFVDLDRHRLIDVVPGRSAEAVSTWLRAKPLRWLAGIPTAVIDPYSSYALGLVEGLPTARLVVDHFHAVSLANQALDEVRRWVQQDTLRHRGRKLDPLYRVRRRLLVAHERLDETVKGAITRLRR